MKLNKDLKVINHLKDIEGKKIIKVEDIYSHLIGLVFEDGSFLILESDQSVHGDHEIRIKDCITIKGHYNFLHLLGVISDQEFQELENSKMEARRERIQSREKQEYERLKEKYG